MNLINDVLELKNKQKHDSDMLYGGFLQEIVIMLNDICKLKRDVEDINRRLNKLEDKE